MKCTQPQGHLNAQASSEREKFASHCAAFGLLVYIAPSDGLAEVLAKMHVNGDDLHFQKSACLYLADKTNETLSRDAVGNARAMVT
jgi:hypothetical protein